MMRILRSMVVLSTALGGGLMLAAPASAQGIAVIQSDSTAPAPAQSQAQPLAQMGAGDACSACPVRETNRPALRHVLNGHGFLPSVFIPTEFVDTRVTLGIAVGYGSYDATLLRTTSNVKLGAFNPALDVQIAFVDWLALNVGLTGNAVAGLNASSVLQYGGSVAYTWRFGLLGRIFRSDSSNLALAFEVDRPHLLAVSPLESAVQTVQESLGNASSEFPSNGVETQYKPSLRFAHGFSPIIGLRSFVGFNFQTGQDVNQKRAGNQFNFGVGISSDLYPAIDWPIGITANYRRNQVITSGGTNADVFEFGLYETVSTRFNVGAEFALTDTSRTDTKVVALVARGYFN